MDLHFYRDIVQRHGVGSTLFHAAYRAARKVTPVAIWNAMKLTPELVDATLLVDPQVLAVRSVSAEAMRPFVGEEHMLTDAFLAKAAGRGDRCFPVFEGEELASHCWTSTRPVVLDELDTHLELHFDSEYAYVYNAFTRLSSRGRRLNAIGMAAALLTTTREFHKGLVAYVDSSNFGSLRSMFRMGYQSFGHVLVLKVGDRYFTHSTKGCAEYAFEVGMAQAA